MLNNSATINYNSKGNKNKNDTFSNFPGPDNLIWNKPLSSRGGIELLAPKFPVEKGFHFDFRSFSDMLVELDIALEANKSLVYTG